MKHVSAMIFAMAIIAGGAAAGAENTVASYKINYAAEPYYSVYHGVLFPPYRFAHAPDHPEGIPVVEETAAGIKKHCEIKNVMACVNIATSYNVETGHYGKICFRYGSPYICSQKTRLRGTMAERRSVIYIPRVGQKVSGHFITRDIQNALLVHEIAHVNGWSANHER